MIDRKEQAQFAGELLFGVAETLNGRLKPYAIMIGLMAALEKFFTAFVLVAAEEKGDAGRSAACNAIRAGLESLLHTLNTIESQQTQSTLVQTPPNSHLN